MIGRLRRRRLEHSFGITAAALVMLVIGTTMTVVHYRVEASLMRGLQARGFSIAKSIGAVAKPSLLAYNYAALQVAAESAVEDPDLVYVVIHDKEGGIAGVAGPGSVPADEVVVIPGTSEGGLAREMWIESDDDVRRPVLEAIVPVAVEGVADSWGTVRVGLSYDPVLAELRHVTGVLAGLGLVLAVAGVLLSRWGARRVAAPLRGLADGAEAVAAGDDTRRIPERGAREVADLARSFNLMVDRLGAKAAESAAYQNQLAELNATLEAQVRARTRELEESESQYRTLVEHSPDSILIVQGGAVRFVNRAFEQTFGVSEQVAVDAAFRLETLFDDASAETVARHVRAWEAGETSQPAEVVARGIDGQRHELELRGSRIEFLGRPAAECLLIDMTEAKRLRSELEDTERLRALGELSSGVAHDFNNLLGAILGRVQLMRERGFDEETDGELAVIEQASQDGRETVRRIQEFARQRTDRPFVPVRLDEIVNDAVEITRSRWKTDAERRNVKIRLSVDCECGEAPAMLGNATELREVFTNLVLNAVDAMPHGGELKLRCTRRGEQVQAIVEDTGVGMDEETRRRLFDPFYTTKGQSGTGLGMSVAYGIVTRHDGTFEVSSAVGLGTRFVLEFPSCEELTPPEGADEAATRLRARPGRVLVIDDEAAIATLIEDALSAEGHQVEIAGSGEQGLRLESSGSFDLVLTDLGMPDMSGWEVAERIRSRSPQLPVILVTGWGTALSPDEVERSGVVAVVHKPFEIRELLDATARALEDPAVEPHGVG